MKTCRYAFHCCSMIILLGFQRQTVLAGDEAIYCKNGTNGLTYRVYKAGNVVVTGFEAREYCHAMGGRLASLTSDAQAKDISDWLKPNFRQFAVSYTPFWIGGSNIGESDPKVFRLEDHTLLPLTLDMYPPDTNAGLLDLNLLGGKTTDIHDTNCVILNIGISGSYFYSRVCNITKITAPVICELHGDEMCPIATSARYWKDIWIEFYPTKVNYDQAHFFCLAMGADLRDTSRSAASVQEVMKHEVCNSERKDWCTQNKPEFFYKMEYEENGKCKSLAMVNVTDAQYPVNCIGSPDGRPFCQFYYIKVTQGQPVINFGFVPQDDSYLEYPDGCIQLMEGCFLFVDNQKLNPPLQTFEEFQKYCEGKSGTVGSYYPEWKLSAIRLAFLYNDTLKDYQHLSFQSNLVFCV